MFRCCHSYLVPFEIRTSIQMVQPFEYQTLKSPVFRWIWYLGVRHSDGYCTIKSTTEHVIINWTYLDFLFLILVLFPVITYSNKKTLIATLNKFLQGITRTKIYPWPEIHWRGTKPWTISNANSSLLYKKHVTYFNLWK